MKDSELNKGQLRKLNAYRKSVNGDEKSAQAMFKIYIDAQPTKDDYYEDPTATLIEEILAKSLDAKTNLGRAGYTIKRAKGKGASGFTATKNS